MDLDIKYIKDTEGNNFFPVVNEKGVVDDNGTTLESKLQSKQDAISDIDTIRSNANSAIQSVIVGTTTTGAAGTNASVTNTGTATAPVLSFTIPQGAQGIQGIQGPQGERGPQGNTGVQVDSVASIIHSIDPTATYAAADVAGADAVQDVLAEVTELSGEVDWKDEGANQFDISNASFTIQYTNFLQASKSGDTITITAKRATGSNPYVCGISPFTPTSGEKYILAFDYVNTCGEASMPSMRSSSNTYIDVFYDESQNARTIPVGSGSVEWEFTAPANVGMLGMGVMKNTSVGNGLTISNIKLYQQIDVPLNQKVAELATYIQDVEDEVDRVKWANIFNLSEKTLGVYNDYTNVWAPSQSGDTATWTVATKQNYSYVLYVSPVVLTEGKKYHITFDYVNQAASAVTPVLRTSENVYIDTILDSIPVGNGVYSIELLAPANVGLIGFSANANVAVGSIFSVSNIVIKEIKNFDDFTEDCVNSIESINDEISEINGILKPSEVVTLEQGLWQNGAKVSPSSASQRVRTTDLLKCPLSLSVNSGYNILRLERYDEDKNLVSSDWVSSGRTEVELKDFGYATFTINNTSNTAISPSENIISDYTAGLEMLFKSDAISTDSLDMPLLGYGRKVISRPTETYCHNPIVRETPEYIFVCYQSSTGTTYEDSQNHFQHILLSINKRSGKKRYVTLFADADAETIGGNTISYVYNQSICPLSDTTLLIRTGCNLNDKWQLIYKVYDATANTLTDAAISQISYNGSTVDFTCANYMTMCNTLYNTGETVIEKPYTLDIAGMWKDGSTIYTLMALKNAWVLMTSADGITWSPVACPYVKVPSETEICVYNSKIYYTCRAQSQSQIGYFVTDLSGTILKEWTTVSTVMTKPYITACGGRVFIMYNISSGVSKFYGRNKVQFAEVNTSTYVLTNIRTYASRNGYNYYCIAPTTTENLIFVNTEDCRGLNYSANRNCTNDVNIAYIELLE